MEYYINQQTGELFFSHSEAMQDFAENYDGDDPTNGIRFSDMYTTVHLPVRGDR